MGYNHYDLDLAMRGVAAPGEAIAQNRTEMDRRTQLGIENELRERELETAMRRQSIEQSREDLLSKGSVDGYLGDGAGMQLHYQGPKSGYDGLIQKSGGTLKAITPEKTQFGSTLYLQDGKVELQTNDPEELQKHIDALRKANKTVPQNRAVAKPSAVAIDDRATALEQERDQLQSSIGTAEPQSRVSIQSQIDGLNKRISILRSPRNGAANYDTVSVSTGPFGSTTNRTSRIPHDQALAPAHAASPAATPNAIFSDKTGRRFRYSGSGDPSSDRDPANWQLIP